MLHNVNPHISNFKAALASVPENERNRFKFIISADRRPIAAHPGRYNAPTTNEVAVVLFDQECDKRDIVLRTHDDRLQRISETHRAYDSLQYPLMFCRGEDGYHFAHYNVDPQTGSPNYNKKTSTMQFYSFLIQLRVNNVSYIHYYRTLLSQFLVDMYAKIETERLVFIRCNQRKLRAENYVHLRDAMQNDVNAQDVGRMVILPSTFTGGPRYMHERTQDAFCYVRKFGRPDLFITITTNPKWPEITAQLLAGQASYDRHDLISRVFHLKLKCLMDLLTKAKVFGAVRCHMYSVEWQKRGLPHAHLLLWLEEKIRPNQIDQVISAELPDPDVDPVLHQIVKSHMVHGPCGTLNPSSPCMKDGRCTKRFPKNFTIETITGEDGYPSYRRRSPAEGGHSTELSVHGQAQPVDNRWIVPYSPVLSRTFQTHINVESCTSVESIKYICKYVNKGSDQATFALQSSDKDEVTKYQSGRYISTSEAVWRILAFSIHDRHPTVMHLDVHLENGQRIYFDPDNVADRLENPRQTTLLAFFRLCEVDQFARSLTYDQVPSYYTYDRQRGVFNRRQRGSAVEGFPGIFKDTALGRVYTVHPNNGECYFLRLLLHTVRGPTSFAFLRTYDGVEYPTYRAACVARHLLDDDQNWDDTLAEASISDSPSRMRHLFAVILVFCGVANPVTLWQKYRHYLSEDFLRALRRATGDEIDVTDERVLNTCLSSLQDMVISIGGNPLIEYGLPAPQSSGHQDRGNREYNAETNYDPGEMTTIRNDHVALFSSEQKQIYDTVLESVGQNQGKMFFLDAPGGTGKTFVTTGILAEVRRQGKIAIAVASSGIAATLLPGGKTAHSMFKIPIDLERAETPVCGVSRNSDKGHVLKDCSLIVWDECTMANRKAVEAVDRTLQDIRRNENLMGGVTVLFSGDFRQTLPVVTRGSRADEVNASLKRSLLWSRVHTLRLTINMRAWLGGNARAQEFSDVLLSLGEGTLPEQIDGQVVLPESLGRVVASLEELIRSVYGDISRIPHQQNSWVCERAILTPKNDQTAAINECILSEIEGNEVVYTSINTVVEQDDATHYPVEFLNSLSASGLPAHTIKLKVGVPIMLLRNLSPPKLCNGTRLKVISLHRHTIEAEILTGCGVGEAVFIPRIPLIPHNFPFQFKRVQFPVSVCFAMTINKSQGQTLRVGGVDLRTSCFSHGQLYVACSRITSPDSLYILAPGSTTTNVVYREVF
ncbi:uncharacterized protein LOC123696361 [Colias croceus]|uniref:uncharacterized protein LOC123696361 n=1 Tax=Colias crocea TaxID=72248 RepID=UPI001E27E38E|nr:uncharacterized protein LOC123696361 [Colias croceus]